VTGKNNMNALLNIGDFVGMVERPVVSARTPNLWYLLRLHPNYDLKAERQCTDHGVTVYVPKEKRMVKSVWGRKVLREIPIFSGAMFIPDFEADIARLKRIAHGIGGFVRNGEQPLAISLSWMDRIRKFEARVQSAAGDRKFKINQRVRIVGGQFDMWEGRVERLDNHYRLRVLINLLQGEVPVELGEDQIEAV
jgi:transcriptional antiterminator RfaH